MGRTAGLAAKRWLAGQQPDEPLYPQQVQVLFSAGVARRLGLSAAVAAKSGAVVLP